MDSGGYGQTLVNPQDPSWKRSKVVDGVRKPVAFQTSYTIEDMCPEIRDGFQHLGLVPQFPAAPAPPCGGTKVPEPCVADVDVSIARTWTHLNFGVGNFVTISGE